jgi:hypothetical protein
MRWMTMVSEREMERAGDGEEAAERQRKRREGKQTGHRHDLHVVKKDSPEMKSAATEKVSTSFLSSSREDSLGLPPPLFLFSYEHIRAI